jgi:predicted transcriptional regulator
MGRYWIRTHNRVLHIVRLELRRAVLLGLNQGLSKQDVARRLGYSNTRIVSRCFNESIRASIKRVRLRHFQQALPPPRPPDPRPPPPPPVPCLSPVESPKISLPLPWYLVESPPSLSRPRKRSRRMMYNTDPLPRAFPAPSPDGPDDDDDRAASPPGASRASSRSSSSSSPSVSGELLPPPDVLQLRSDALKLRKAMIPFDEMAELLGVSESQARKAVQEALHDLQTSEALNADMQRQLMIEQIEQMIAAIHAPATGRLINGKPVMIDLGAIDRMLKLLQRKAELMGLTYAPAEDIKVKLQRLAEEAGYDIVELEDIARDVLQAHKLRLPEFRG